MSSLQQKPWWKQLWPWLLISGPALAMIACGITIWLVFENVDPPIKQGVIRYGLKVVQ